MTDAVLRAAAMLGPATPCLAEEEILDLSRGAVEARRAEEMREHLARCPRCGEAARDGARFLAAMDSRFQARPRRTPAVPWAAAATILIAVGAGLLVGRSERPAPSIPEPPWQVGEDGILFRGEGGAGPSLARARAAWERKAWDEAAAALFEAWRLEPRDDVASQRADALLLAGRHDEAAAVLEDLRGRGDGSARTLLRLALADLARGRREDAAMKLQELAAGAGPEADAARRMLCDRRGLP